MAPTNSAKALPRLLGQFQPAIRSRCSSYGRYSNNWMHFTVRPLGTNRRIPLSRIRFGNYALRGGAAARFYHRARGKFSGVLPGSGATPAG
jgi:hypothetical protein